MHDNNGQMAVRAEEHGALLDRPIELQERIFERLFRTAEIAKMSRQQLYEYEESLKNYRDWRNVLDNAQYEGHVLGLEQGLKKEEPKVLNKEDRKV